MLIVQYSKVSFISKISLSIFIVLALFACDGSQDETELDKTPLSDSGEQINQDSGETVVFDGGTQNIIDSGTTDDLDSGSVSTDSGTITNQDSGIMMTVDSGSSVVIDSGATDDLDSGFVNMVDAGSSNPNINDDILGRRCQDDSECGDGHVCGNLYTTGEKVCYSECASLDMPCSTTRADTSVTGTCFLTQERKSICVVESPEGGVCGDGVNSTCSSSERCISMDAAVSGYGFNGFCLKFCDVNNTTSCNEATGEEYCGCGSGQTCSSDININGNENEGICGVQTQIGDVCGHDRESIKYCSAPQFCKILRGEIMGVCSMQE